MACVTKFSPKMHYGYGYILGITPFYLLLFLFTSLLVFFFFLFFFALLSIYGIQNLYFSQKYRNGVSLV